MSNSILGRALILLKVRKGTAERDLDDFEAKAKQTSNKVTGSANSMGQSFMAMSGRITGAIGAVAALVAVIQALISSFAQKEAAQRRASRATRDQSIEIERLGEQLKKLEQSGGFQQAADAAESAARSVSDQIRALNDEIEDLQQGGQFFGQDTVLEKFRNQDDINESEVASRQQRLERLREQQSELNQRKRKNEERQADADRLAAARAFAKEESQIRNAAIQEERRALVELAQARGDGDEAKRLTQAFEALEIAEQEQELRRRGFEEEADRIERIRDMRIQIAKEVDAQERELAKSRIEEETRLRAEANRRLLEEANRSVQGIVGQLGLRRLTVSVERLGAELSAARKGGRKL